LPIRCRSLRRCQRNSAPYATHRAAYPVLPPLVQPAMLPTLRRVPARPVARWATLRLVAGWATWRPVAQRVQPWRWQRAPRFRWASPQLMRWCRCSTVKSWCARRPNSARPQSVGLPSKRHLVRRSNWLGRHANSAQSQRVGLPSMRHLVRRSNWLGRQPNSAQSQTSNLTGSQPLTPTNLLTKSDPLMTHLPRILMTNSMSTTTNQTTN
jgi:hypothetical protein